MHIIHALHLLHSHSMQQGAIFRFSFFANNTFLLGLTCNLVLRKDDDILASKLKINIHTS